MWINKTASILDINILCESCTKQTDMEYRLVLTVFKYRDHGTALC